MEYFNKVKNKKFDASGVTNPEAFQWYLQNDIYYPSFETLPENKGTDLSDFLGDLWEKIFDAEKPNKALIEVYNKGAKIFNDDVKRESLLIITNFKNQKDQIMATKKKAAKKSAPKKSAPNKAAKTGEKKVSQKTQIVELAGKGKSIDQIVEITGIKKANVQWYFSKLKLGKK